MRPWKVMLGLGAACAACCAIPLLGIAGGLAAFASALWACADEFLPAAILLGAIAAALAGLWWWQRRQAVRSSSCGCATSCSMESKMPTAEPVPIACTLDLQALGPRLAEIRQLTREHLRSYRVEGPALRLTYDTAAAQQVARIVELERACCAFLNFELKASANGVEVAITAPDPEGTDAQWLFAQFLPQTELHAVPARKAGECTCCRG